jgi:hypothetical protein
VSVEEFSKYYINNTLQRFSPGEDCRLLHL